VWKHLEHKNIVRLLGVTSAPLQLVSEWIPGGDLTEYVKKHPGADRLGLVGVPTVTFNPLLTPATSYPVSLTAFITSTHAI